MNKMQDSYHINYTVVNFDGDYYMIPRYALHRPAAQTMINGGLYEPRTHKIVKYILNITGKSMVHGGAFFGDMLPKFSKYCSGKVYVFEPVLENYVMARRCQQCNNLTNIVLFNAAMSNTTGHAHIQTKNDDGTHMGGMSHIAQGGNQLITTLKLDDLKMDELAIIHLDVEGHEIETINGALEKIKSEEPVILMEDSKSKDTSVIEDLGYKLILRSHLIDVWSSSKYEKIAKEAVDSLQ